MNAAIAQATAERMRAEEQARAGTLADACADQRPKDQVVEHRRAFMAGALTTLELLRAGATREQLLAECVQFGRAVGTKAERASF